MKLFSCTSHFLSLHTILDGLCRKTRVFRGLFADYNYVVTVSDYKNIERESISVWHARFFHDTPDKQKNQTAFGLQKWLLGFKSGFSVTKTAFRLQIFSCQLQRLHFNLQSGISPFNLVDEAAGTRLPLVLSSTVNFYFASVNILIEKHLSDVI